MGQFSDDGQWWWDGTQWIATSQVVIPDLARAATDDARKLLEQNRQMQSADKVGLLPILPEGATLPAMGWLIVENRFYSAYRLWQLEMLSDATTYLLGPADPMVVGEATLYWARIFGRPTPDLGVVVTTSHVLVFRLDPANAQPRWIELAARACDVQVQSPTPIFTQPTVVVRRGNQVWVVQGRAPIMRPKLVVAAWESASAAKPLPS